MSLATAPGRPPLVTVITAVWNGGATLVRTLLSVLEQTHVPVEHVVVDGGSTDGSLELIRRWSPHLRYVTGPDRGIYDAMNKGLGLVTDPESYVIFLNADDEFAGRDAVERALRAAAGEDLVYGLLERFDAELDYRDVIGCPVSPRDLVLGMKCQHQALLCRRRAFDRVGPFDLRYRIAADYDWVVRAFLDSGLSRRHVPEVVAVMRRGGVSDRRYLSSVRERWDIVRRHYPWPELLRYTAYTGFGDYLRYWTQQGLKRVGLLNRARDAKRALLARRPGGTAGTGGLR
ncbi:MAG TPA: glycosyltransferase family 2 protein [Candidatus Eisenbacteria bacterium]|jgi:glycosyltransferase involved in cell wall biosynthesis